MPRVAVIIGTRPEGIKMAAVCRALQDAPDMDPVLVSTGQHREMLAQVLEVFGLEADVELDLMRGNQSLAGLTARLFEALDGMLELVAFLLEVHPLSFCLYRAIHAFIANL